LKITAVNVPKLSSATSLSLAFYLSASGVTDGRAGGHMPRWQLRCGPLFRNGPPSTSLAS